MKQVNRFKKGSGMFACRICKKNTRAVQCGSAASILLCQDCYDRAGMENEHSDDGHEGEFENCPICFPK